MFTAFFAVLILSSLWFFFHETYKQMSFYDKMFMWEIIRNIIAIVFFCTIGVNLCLYFIE